MVPCLYFGMDRLMLAVRAQALLPISDRIGAILLAMVIVTVAASEPAFAQGPSDTFVDAATTDKDRIETVVVTARRREENL